MNTRNRKLDQETIIICGLMAAVAALGILFFPIVLLGIDVTQCNSTMLVAIFSVLTGGIWGILLCRNC